MQETFLEHSHYLNLIKKVLKASYVGWVTEKNTKSLRVIVNGDEHLLPLEGEIRHETYTDLITQLLKKNESGE